LTRAGPLAWRTGAGWLVLVGGGPRGAVDWDHVDTAILGWAIPGRPSAAVVTAAAAVLEAEGALESWADLGGASAYVVELLNASDAHQAENVELLSEAGLVYLADGPSALGIVRTLRGSPALDAIGYAFEDGAPIVAVGAAAVALGAWVADSALPSQGEPGLAWVPNVVVAPHFTGAENAEGLRQLLMAHGDCLGLGVPAGSALALGPGGRIETLGPSQVTVVLGQDPTS
jgi:cyanophycinase-like exopeptidase